MDIETPVDIKQEQLPQIRRVTRLDEIPRVIPARPIPQVPKKITPAQKPKSFLRYYLIGLIVFGIISLALAIIYRVDTLNNRLYNISLSLKDKVTALQYKFQHTNKINVKLVTSRKGLIGDYMKLNSQYRILQFKMDNYKGIFKHISLAKSSKIDVLGGDLRVVYARVSAVDAQNELLIKKLAERGESINELTSKLIKNIGEQEALVNENLRLKEESSRLSRDLQNIKENTGTTPLEDRNAIK